MKKLLLSLTLLLLSLSSFATMPNFEGEEIQMGRESHGGDRIGIEFLSSVRSAIAKLKLRGPKQLPTTETVLEQTITKLKVIVTDDELKVEREGNTQISTAINFYNSDGNPVVKVNRKNWEQMTTSNRQALALHELLCLLKFEKTYDYKYSSKISNSILIQQLLTGGYTCDPKFQKLKEREISFLLGKFQVNGSSINLRFFVDYQDHSIKYLQELKNEMIGNFTTSRETKLCSKGISGVYYIPAGGMLVKLNTNNNHLQLSLFRGENSDYLQNFNRLED